MGAGAMLEQRSPRLAVRCAKDGHSGAHVLYWMTSARRTSHNLALQHAVELAVERNLPPLVVEALAIGHPARRPKRDDRAAMGRGAETLGMLRNLQDKLGTQLVSYTIGSVNSSRASLA